MKKGYPSYIPDLFVVVLVLVLLYENSYFEAKSKEKTTNNHTHPDCLKQVKKIVIGTDWFRNCEVGIISTLRFVLTIGNGFKEFDYSRILLNFPCH